MVNLQLEKATASKFLAAAFLSIYRSAKSLSGGVKGSDFFFDFLLSEDETVDLSAVEDRVYSFLERKLRIRAFSMERKNASEYLGHLGFFKQAELVRSSKEKLLDLIELENFVDIGRGPFSYDFHFFKIYDLVRRGDKIRIYGALFERREDLKRYIKLKREYKKKNSAFLGERLNLFYFEGGEPLYTKYGKTFKDLVLEFFEKDAKNWGFLSSELKVRSLENYKNFLERGKNFLKPPYRFFQESVLNMEKSPFEIGLFASSSDSNIILTEILKKSELKKSVKYLLDSFLYRLKSFGFKASLTLKRGGNMLEEVARDCGVNYFFSDESFHDLSIFLEDISGSYRLGPFIDIKSSFKKENSYGMVESSFGRAETYMSLFLEAGLGVLPFFLTPLQVMILPVNLGCVKFAEKLESLLRKGGFRADVIPPQLGSLKRRAATTCPYFVAVIGERESARGEVSFREAYKKEVKLLDVCNFLKMLEGLKSGLGFENK